jgi:hypothetical protein
MKKIVITIGVVAVVIALGLGVFNFVRPVPKVEAPTQPAQTEVGAVPGSDFPGPGFSVAGFKSDYPTTFGMPKTAATNKVLCVTKVTATSTIDVYRFSIVTGTSTAASVALATSTSATATSTTNEIAAYSVPANNGIDVNVNLADGINNDMVYPNQYILLVTKGFGSGAYGYVYGGSCKVKLGKF